MKILIVDDDKYSSIYLLKILSEYGKCDIASNGIEAVDAFLLAHEEGLPYDLISLDLMLPLLDGEDVLSVIRGFEDKNNIKASERVKIVITSALNDEELILKLKKHGIDKYFMKPIKAEKIIEYLESL
ncbi:MAG: response regulator transcription factor [Clostridia bacterium]|jgi:two-component system chemotaxis response regulator CheY|nr:response regulator transcription factor [Clostridia bacterium]